MNNEDLYIRERWRDIPEDLKFHYQASDLGRICHVYPDGHRRILKECYVKSLSGWCTGLTMADGTYRKFQTVTLVARAWIGPCEEGMQAIHKNGIRGDHRVENIMYIPRKKIGTIANRKKRKAVLKINQDGEVVEVYKSAKDAADKNYYSYATIKRRCLGDFKSPIGEDGYAYCYEDDTIAMRKLIRQLELLRGDLPENKNKYAFDW